MGGRGNKITAKLYRIQHHIYNELQALCVDGMWDLRYMLPLMKAVAIVDDLRWNILENR